MNIEEIGNTIIKIRNAIELQVNSDDISGLEKKLNDLSALSGNAAQIVGDCRGIVLRRQNEIMDSLKDTDYPPNKLKYILDGKMAEELSLFMHAKELNDGLGKTMISISTVLSVYKEELKNSMRQRT